MKVFEKYARYYDLLYQDKDYAKEVGYIHQLLQRYAPGSQSVLELGCGTGVHACFLAELGYRIHGIDASEEMLRQAREHVVQRFPQCASQVTFQQGDIRNIRLGKQFDAILSLFHVISYQTSNEDLRAVFEVIHHHLNPSGVCIFDFWYGPAVLTDRPVVRVKRLENEQNLVTRIAEPVMYLNQNLVEVNYEVLIEDKKTHRLEKLSETHKMRYLFYPELEYMLPYTGLKIAASLKWMDLHANLGEDSWYGVLVVQKQG
ncbi:methyltransferase type 11 [Candidatus Vecturithrix granuli]|uniref:Methyltransferase type 11 n=1 Tax=Vecturithrix granuli TaxID=1499967 RepID=A0A0S6WAN5_VECG1|nr:methyltransferase type 11 [Candidatus Vecturithrix granuli]